jgi:CheY-like chemotaxis protein
MIEENKVTQKRKIFFIDDDTFLLDMYALKFSKAGYEVQTSDSTDSALAKIKGGYIPDIMLTDIVMPGMDGLELVNRLRSDNVLPKDTMVIMLTNQSASDDISRAKKLGIDGYIVKATTIPSEVLNEVEKIWQTKKS